MPVIVHNGTDHVEQKRRALRGNKISCKHRSMVGAKASPLHPFRIIIKRKITVLRGIQKEKTTPVYPMRSFALTWHADVGNIMHTVPCIAYCIHQRCHLLSLDMLCVNAICLVSLSYM